MVHPRLIVCEKTGSWSVSLRTALADSDVPIYEVRTWSDAWSAVQQTPTGLLAVELGSGGLEDLVRGLITVGRRFPDAGCVALTTRAFAGCAWTLREAGALYVACSSRNLDPLARLIRRFLAAAPQPERSLRETIMDRLPWAPRDGRG